MGPTASAARAFADEVYEVPWSYGRHVPESAVLVASVTELDIDLVIPATDLDAVVLKKAAEDGLVPPVAGSPSATAHIFFDKWLTALSLRDAGLPFAASFLPDTSEQPEGQVIAKPRRGGLSEGVMSGERWMRGAFKNSEDYVLQERLVGPELTVSFYVDLHGHLVGFLALERTMRNGMTWSGKTAEWANNLVKPVVDGIVSNFEITGFCNVQGIVVPARGFVPFEINCRVSGSALVRHALNFRDVHWLINEHAKRPLPFAGKFQTGEFVRGYDSWVFLNEPIYAGP